jgi:hypothetical protein
VSKEELATARLYFKQPGHVSPTQDSASFFYTGIRKFLFNGTFTNEVSFFFFFLDGITSGLEVCKQFFW